MRPPIEICDRQLKIITDLTEQLSTERPQLKLRIPESLTPGPQYDFVHDFNYEMYREAIAEPLKRFPSKTITTTKYYMMMMIMMMIMMKMMVMIKMTMMIVIMKMVMAGIVMI